MKAIKLANVELEKFLKSKKAYRKFIKNCIGESDWMLNVLKTRTDLRISSCFIFSHTPEGLDFWYNLQDEFLKTK